MTNEERAYAAGIVDGEGCLTVAVRKNRIYPRLTVTNTNPTLPLLFKNWFGGWITEDSKPYIPRAKIRYIWELNGKPAVGVIKELLPYLRLKAVQAELLLELWRAKGRKQQETLANGIRRLNRRGTDAAA